MEFPLVVLAFFVPGYFCNIQTDDNTRTGQFENPRKGHVLVGHVIATHFVTSQIDCTFECLGHSRCVSYNYREGNASRNLCELNDQTQATRPRDYQNRPGFTYYEAAADGKKESLFTVKFPDTQTHDCIKTILSQSLTEFTICFWLKTQQNNFHVFTYATEEFLQALAFTIRLDSVFKLSINDQEPAIKSYMVPLLDDKWHHVCLTWETTNGTHKIYVDGILKRDKAGFAVGEVVQGGGDFVIGQMQEALGGNFRLSRKYNGYLNSFNVWNKEFDGHVVTRMFEECEVENWAVLSWADLRQLIGGNLITFDESPCSSKAKSAANFQLEFNDASVANYAVYKSAIPELREFTLCMWFTLLNGHGSLFSYVTPNQSRALLGVLVSNKTLLLSINNGTWVNVPALDLTDKGWHHLCWTWKSSDGLHGVYFDRKKLTAGTGYGVGEIIAANGTFVVGQEQDENGILNHSRPFYGRMSHLNIWSRYLKINSIRAMNSGCENIDGNALAWPVFHENRFGLVRSHSPAVCLLPVYRIQKKRDKICNDKLNSTSTCFGPLVALFDRKADTSAKQWRCYYSNAVKEERGQEDTGRFIIKYNNELKSTCVSNKFSWLRTVWN